MTEQHTPCMYLPWDSEFFGYRVAQVVGYRLSSTLVVGIHDWCSQNEIECLYFLADSDHGETVALAERAGFHLVDVRVMFVMSSIGNLPAPMPDPVGAQDVKIRVARSSDVSRLEAIARTAHKDTRFYYDRHFSTSRCSDLYATWILQSCEAPNQKVLVAEHDGQVVGYVSWSYVPGEAVPGHIGLVGVDARARGMNIGTALIRHALHGFAVHGVQEVRVVTQGRNVPAQRLYQRCGFVTHSLQLWYHKWFLLRQTDRVSHGQSPHSF